MAALSHRRRRPAPSQRAGQRGYILVTFALLLVPILLMAGFSVDVGSWYNRASNIQKAADAASLAGVVWLPDETKARSVALDVAKRNGFDSTDPNISVTVAKSTKADNRLKVTITDNRVGSFLYERLGGNTISITRTSFAEYVLPVKMGSPDNSLGNDPTKPGYPSGAPNLWASISGPQSAVVDGDPYSTKNSAEYRNWGYVYVVDVPASAVGQTLSVAIYDASMYERPNYPNVETADRGNVNTQFEMFRPDDTPLSSLDGLTSAYSLAGGCNTGPGVFKLKNKTGAATYQNKWATLCSVTVNRPGQYMMQVKTSNLDFVADGGSGWNQFSVKANLSGAVQPALYTVGDLSLFNNLPGQAGSFSANFYLAEVKAIHAGKTLKVSMYDPGDGQSGSYFANILGPGGSGQSCKYRERGASSWTAASPCRIQTRTSSGSNVYNGKWLDIEISLPNGYTCASGGTDCWWKVKYDFNSVTSGNSPNDRTVWSAKVTGDPVHLLEEN